MKCKYCDSTGLKEEILLVGMLPQPCHCIAGVEQLAKEKLEDILTGRNTEINRANTNHAALHRFFYDTVGDK